MQRDESTSIGRFWAALDERTDKADQAQQPPPVSMVGSVTLMQGDVIILGEVPAKALELVLGRRKKVG